MLEIIGACEPICGRSIPYMLAPRRPGDPETLVASSEKIRGELGWEPAYTGIDPIASSAWSWHRTHPEGYGSAEQG